MILARIDSSFERKSFKKHIELRINIFQKLNTPSVTACCTRQTLRFLGNPKNLVVTHTAGPGADRNLCSPFCPPGALSLSASRRKMAWELRRLIQFTNTVCTADSSA